MELRNHWDVMVLHSSHSAVHAWDFIFCEGDSIREKFQSLHEIIRVKCVRGVNSKKVALMVGSGDIPALLTTCEKIDDFVPAFEERGEITYLGELRHECGGNGYISGYHLYRDDQLPKDELLVSCGGEVSLVKLFNCLL